MIDRNKQEQVQIEATYQTLSEFLQSTPPNQWRYISNLSVPQNIGPYPDSSRALNKPELELHCSDDLCKGVRFFRYPAVYSCPGPHLRTDTHNYLYVSYQCSNCLRTTKVFSFIAILDTNEESHGGVLQTW